MMLLCIVIHLVWSIRLLKIAAGLGEFKIRDLNDEINKLLREKGHWQDRIKELGGPDYWVRLHKLYDRPIESQDYNCLLKMINSK